MSAAGHRGRREESEALSLTDSAQTLLDECRMVLPGVQAIFGFQLIAVFNQRFTDLATAQQLAHLAALFLVGVAAGLVMTPAAIHRMHGARHITSSFIDLSSLLVVAAMPLLALGLCIDVYVIAHLVIEGAAPIAIAFALGAIMLFLWTIFPRLEGLQRRIARARHH